MEQITMYFDISHPDTGDKEEDVKYTVPALKIDEKFAIYTIGNVIYLARNLRLNEKGQYTETTNSILDVLPEKHGDTMEYLMKIVKDLRSQSVWEFITRDIFDNLQPLNIDWI
ncbi:hypothetical protein [Heyndrickxia oleronia]|jgi:hypothetical protein|uniref:hypothetical protein n=1 Tax=Heyndrickxia oleronia TaxID=38875 RepID=UPI00242ED2EE|nr:hypothetical protein [Heyndrickxia oleronia]MCI1589570.1 hypothetical protein [Heyndrickxia oleronia]MCI1611376.1 hypothetical protein [Heyndrickxia oleronia]MCI1742818.1 hypothetical protein [Heyndrickxia oleronia]MCI1759897.1 hypothetical protein [Heyndrickxia oleronia]